MVFYYAKGGLIANLALIANIFFIFGTLASLGAALTLPGIAGIVLTIGMAVDANVLVFERIREELRHGKGTKAAIQSGYAKALSAILDANVTTLLTAIVLGYFGTGAVKGFAVTLIVGIFTSLFASLVITRLIFSYMLDAKKEISFSTKLTENIFTKTAWKFIGRRKIFYILSGLVIAGGIFSLSTKGLDYGVEFTGGQTYKIQFLEKEANIETLRGTLADAFGEQPEVKKIDNKFKALITTQYLLEDKSADKLGKIQTALDKGLAGMGKYEILESRQVAGGISKDFRNSSIYAIVFSLLIVFIYILIRFRKWQFGFGALLAMFHDVLIVLSLFSIFYGVLPFSMEIDQAFIAAILTVVGYSINDTVVVFDRIREYLTEKHREDSSEIINKALNSTLSRTVNTSVTTFLVLLVIFIFGGGAIKGMTFALMIGVVVGTYSSLCIATPSVVDLTKAFNFKKKQKL
jgi:SecD/SecF fusion protein